MFYYILIGHMIKVGKMFNSVTNSVNAISTTHTDIRSHSAICLDRSGSLFDDDLVN